MISFSNEIADLCATVGGVDVVDVMRACPSVAVPHASQARPAARPHRSPRSSRPAAASAAAACPRTCGRSIARGEQAGRPLRLLQAVIQVNEERPDEVVSLLRTRLPQLDGARIAVLGLAFKPGTDDVRESPAIPIVTRLVAAGAIVRIHDPVVTALPEELGSEPRVGLSADLADTVRNADAVVLVTRWAQYAALAELLESLGVDPVVVDGRPCAGQGPLRALRGHRPGPSACAGYVGALRRSRPRARRGSAGRRGCRRAGRGTADQRLLAKRRLSAPSPRTTATVSGRRTPTPRRPRAGSRRRWRRVRPQGPLCAIAEGRDSPGEAASSATRPSLHAGRRGGPRRRTGSLPSACSHVARVRRVLIRPFAARGMLELPTTRDVAGLRQRRRVQARHERDRPESLASARVVDQAEHRRDLRRRCRSDRFSAGTDAFRRKPGRPGVVCRIERVLRRCPRRPVVLVSRKAPERR